MPLEIRDELALLRYARLTSQVPVLYVTLIAVVCTAMLAAAQGAPWLVRIGIPAFVTLFGAIRFLWWMSNRHRKVTADEARHLIRRLIWISTSIAALCSIWCLASWVHAAPEEASYYPLFMAMGSLTTAFCLSAIRLATVLNLLMGIAPISLGLMLLGDRMDMIAGSIILIATAFLTRMILGQHDQLIDLLMLKHQLREQANTDPLTGLLNRRALMDGAEAACSDNAAKPALALIDLDGFKAVNDRFGHAAGDAVLVMVADRMRNVVGGRAALARLGGDEFALLAHHGADDALALLVDQTLAALVPPFVVAGHRLALGASAGLAAAPTDGRSTAALFVSADKALYAAKAQRNRRSSDAKSSVAA